MGAVFLKETNNELGIFAKRKIKKKEIILTFKGKILDFEEIEADSYENDHCIQIGERTYLGPSGEIDDFMNHSCNPNSGVSKINNEFKLIAIKEIKCGEEITLDYSTTMNEEYWEMECSCKSKNCRKKIKDFKFLPKATQQKYIKLGVVPKFILKKIK